jgi:predicted DNA-binding transcriptional regulator AlpA
MPPGYVQCAVRRSSLIRKYPGATMEPTQSDFIAATELATLVGVERKSIYNWHSAGSGPLNSILVKVGGRLGCWRSDYEQWRDSQRRLKPTAEQRPAA